MAAAFFPVAVPITAIDRLSAPLAKMGGSLGKFGGKALRAGKTLSLGLSAPVVGLGIATIAASAGFEKGMNRVQALTGDAGEGMVALKAQALDLGSTTEFSAREAAEGMGFLAQSGQDVLEIQATLPSVLRLASAAQLDLASSADLTTNIMKGYGIGVERAGFATDVLAEATTKGNTDLVQLADGMKFAGPVAKSLGQEFTTTVAILDKLADAGFQGQLGGNVLKRAMVSLIEPTGSAARILDKLNISQSDLFDDQGNLRDMIGTIELLQKQGAIGTDIMQIFGRTAGPGMAALLGQSTEEMRLLVDQLDNSGGRALEIQEIQLQGAAGAVVRLKSAFEGLLIAIGESGLLEAFADVVSVLTDVASGLKDTDPRLLRLGVVVAGVAAAIGPALVLIGAMATGVGAIGTLVSSTVQVLATLASTITGTVIPAVGSLFAFLLANPIGLVITAVGLLIVAGVSLWKNWKQISAGFGLAWDFIVDKVGAAAGFVMDKVTALLSFLPDWLVDLLSFSATASGDPIAGAIADGVNSRRLDEAVAARSEQLNRTEGTVRVKFSDLPVGAEVTTEGDVAGVDVETGPNLLALT